MGHGDAASTNGAGRRESHVEAATRNLERLARFMVAIGEGRTPDSHPFPDSIVPVSVFARMVSALRSGPDAEAALDRIEEEAMRSGAPYLDDLRLDRRRLLTIRSCVLEHGPP